MGWILRSSWFVGSTISFGDWIVLVPKRSWSLWTYDLTNHIMVDLETIIALAIVTFVVEKNVYELHPMNEEVFNDFINDK